MKILTLFINERPRPILTSTSWVHLTRRMQPGQDSGGAGGTKVQVQKGGVYCVQEGGGGGGGGQQLLAHSLRSGGSRPVPACVRPLPVGFNAGNEAKWCPVEVGRSDSKK